jgi:hypothetical protein
MRHRLFMITVVCLLLARRMVAYVSWTRQQAISFVKHNLARADYFLRLFAIVI